jgi:hypothetical protein
MNHSTPFIPSEGSPAKQRKRYEEDVCTPLKPVSWGNSNHARNRVSSCSRVAAAQPQTPEMKNSVAILPPEPDEIYSMKVVTHTSIVTSSRV